MHAIKKRLKSLASVIMVPIFSGPLKGKWWSLFTNIKYVKGSYTPLYTNALMQLIKPGDVVYDIGAHVGYFSVLASVLSGQKGTVIAFEPFPINLLHLKRHISANKCRNVRIIESCVGDREGTAMFDDSFGTGTVRLSEKGSLTVPITTLDILIITKVIPPPRIVKMNIEGAEVAALTGAEEMIRQYHPAFLISLHGKDMEEGCIAILKKFGYTVEFLSFDTIRALTG